MSFTGKGKNKLGTSSNQQAAFKQFKWVLQSAGSGLSWLFQISLKFKHRTVIRLTFPKGNLFKLTILCFPKHERNSTGFSYRLSSTIQNTQETQVSFTALVHSFKRPPKTVLFPLFCPLRAQYSSHQAEWTCSTKPSSVGREMFLGKCLCALWAHTEKHSFFSESRVHETWAKQSLAGSQT